MIADTHSLDITLSTIITPFSMASSPTRAPSPSFFQGAPWTKLSCMAWIVGHVMLNNHNKKTTHLSSSSPLLFASTGDLVMGLLWLAPNLRQVERELGSSQWLVWLGWVSGFGFTVGYTFFLLAGGDDDATSNIPSWSLPNILFGATLAHYLKFVPRLHPRFVGIFGFHLSEKALQSLWAWYVLGHGGWSSILQGSIGMVGSLLYFGCVPKHLPLTMPKAVIDALPWESLSGLFFLDLPSKIYVPLMMAHGNGGTARGGGGGPRPPSATATTAPRPTTIAPISSSRVASLPSPEAMEQLTAMGFDEERVRQALQATNNNVEQAANLLLMG